MLETGETEPLWKQPFEWAGSFITPRAAEVVLSVDETAMETTIAELEGEETPDRGLFDRVKDIFS